MINMGDNNNNVNVNNWNDVNDKVLRNWKTSLSESIYIYQYVLDNIQWKLNFILLVIKIFAVICGILAAILVALTGKDINGNVNNDTVVILSFTSSLIITIIFNGIIAFLNGLVVILAYAIVIYKMDTNIAAYSAYINNMDQVYSTIASQLLLPYSLRTDAITFITNMDKTFTDLIAKNPNIDLSDQEKAMKDYKRFIDGKIINYNYAQKYSKDDAMVSVI